MDKFKHIYELYKTHKNAITLTQTYTQTHALTRSYSIKDYIRNDYNINNTFIINYNNVQLIFREMANKKNIIGVFRMVNFRVKPIYS